MAMTLEEGWRGVDAGLSRVKRILAGTDTEKITGAEHIGLYTSIYTICMHYPDEKVHLYTRFKKELQDYTKTVVLPSLNDKHDQFLLRELVERWKNHNVMVRSLSLFFRKVEGYVRWKSLMPLRDLGTSCFFDLVFNQLKATLPTIIIDMIADERDGQLIDRALVKDVLDIYVVLGRGSLGLYHIYFEEELLKSTADYYSKKAQAWISEDSLSVYMFKAEECIRKEKERVVQYLHSSTEPKLLQVTMLKLINWCAEQILNNKNSGFKVLLVDIKSEDLARAYRLFYNIGDRMALVSIIFEMHVKEEGMSLLKQVADAATIRKDERKDMPCSLEQDFGQKAIELYAKHLAYVTNCFGNMILFHKALRSAFEFFLNRYVEGCSIAESLAAFCDNILRKGGSEKLSDDAVEETLDKVVEVLTLVIEKDVFVEFHRKKLGKRLLLFKGVNIILEQSLVSKLKPTLGTSLASKLECMLIDKIISKEHQTQYEAYVRDKYPGPFPQVDVTVMRRGNWPSCKTLSINLPSEMVRCVEIFDKHYKSQHTHRKLTWIHAMGLVNLIANFDTKTVELIVNTYQAALLLLFNEVDQLSYSEIVDQLAIPHEDAIPLLRSLSCSKYKILVKEPSNQTICDKDTFRFNKKFSEKMRRIKLPFPQAAADDKKTVADVYDGRKYKIELCIVRTMKSRKVLSHTLLVEECIRQLSHMFKPDVAMIKKRIEDLINRDYLERDPEDQNTYKYLSS